MIERIMGLIQNNELYLITTNHWFFGPDGEQYRSVYGRCELIEAKAEMGFTPARSANWYVRIGNDSSHMIIAGCQIHYLLRTDDRPVNRPGMIPPKEGELERPINCILFLDGEI